MQQTSSPVDINPHLREISQKEKRNCLRPAYNILNNKRSLIEHDHHKITTDTDQLIGGLIIGRPQES